MMMPVTATYRLQLRNGVDFDTACGLVPVLSDLGFSHLYLSPIFTAQTGSTHGYDITDPTEIDPALGGVAGYARLAQAARASGMGIILDIVPNHTAFSIENPWLRDVLRNGADSRYADHFDIDWSQRLVLPWLPEPFEVMLDRGDIAVRDGHMVAGDLKVPMDRRTPDTDIAKAHDAQPWRLTHWQHERDGITHRRFFSVTGLIGMRVEDDHVFEVMHAKLFDLIARGDAHGVRVDHVDGLADPAGYLSRLNARVGDAPIWVEKILTGDETLPKEWPVVGTTGYEAARQIVRVLTDPTGHDCLQREWIEETGDSRSFHEAVLDAKKEVLTGELAAELHQLLTLGQAVLDEDDAEVGPETLREALIGLMIYFPRYRSYLTENEQSEEDVLLIRHVADRAAQDLRDRTALDRLATALIEAATSAERRWQTRFQQVSGALIAKSHEDTAAFRQTAYLATCEVGADPDTPVISPEAMQEWCSDRNALALTLTSSHDTKRSEDARMRLVAMSHCPDAALALIGAAGDLPQAHGLTARDRWYVAQAAIAIWDPETETLTTRLCDHVTKALREAALLTSWTHPDENAEAEVLDFARAILKHWQDRRPKALDQIVETGAHLSLTQTILRMMLPGVPDIYQSCLSACFSLTDPDNRRPVDFDLLQNGPRAGGLSQDKFRLIRGLLDLRTKFRDLFEHGEAIWSHDETGLTLIRRFDDREIAVRINHNPPSREITVDGEPLSLKDS